MTWSHCQLGGIQVTLAFGSGYLADNLLTLGLNCTWCTLHLSSPKCTSCNFISSQTKSNQIGLSHISSWPRLALLQLLTPHPYSTSLLHLITPPPYATGVLTSSSTEKGGQLNDSVPMSSWRQPSNPRLRIGLLG